MYGAHDGRWNACCRCPNGTTLTDGETGEVVCQACGYVAADRTEYSRAQGRQSDQEGGTDMALSLTPNTLLLHDMGLSTIMGRHDRDATGKAISGEAGKTIGRLRRMDKRSYATRHKPNYTRAFIEINRIRKVLGIGVAVAEKAAYIYRKVYDKQLIRNGNTLTLAAASLYVASREMQVRRTLREIAEASGTGVRNVGQYYRRICGLLDLRMPPVRPAGYISRIAGAAGLSEKTRVDALGIMRMAEERRITAGKNPLVMAAATIFVAAARNGEDAGVGALAQASGVTPISIRVRVNDCRRMLDGIGTSG